MSARTNEPLEVSSALLDSDTGAGEGGERERGDSGWYGAGAGEMCGRHGRWCSWSAQGHAGAPASRLGGPRLPQRCGWGMAHGTRSVGVTRQLHAATVVGIPKGAVLGTMPEREQQKPRLYYPNPGDARTRHPAFPKASERMHVSGGWSRVKRWDGGMGPEIDAPVLRGKGLDRGGRQHATWGESGTSCSQGPRGWPWPATPVAVCATEFGGWGAQGAGV